MFVSETSIRVRYAETDQMGYVYYGNYPTYFEVGRVEAIRELGMTYADMERKHGVLMPVASMEIKYLRPIFYDELITVKTSIIELPVDTVQFKVQVFNEKETLTTIGKVKLAFIDKHMNRIQAPDFFIEKLKPFYN